MLQPKVRLRKIHSFLVLKGVEIKRTWNGLSCLVLFYLQEGPTYYNQDHPLDIVPTALLEAVKTN